jgi:hypothetical protein
VDELAVVTGLLTLILEVVEDLLDCCSDLAVTI